MVTGIDLRDIDTINTGNVRKDHPGGHDGLGLCVDDSRGSYAVGMETVEDIGTDRGTLPLGEDEDLAGDTLTFKLMALFNDDTGLGVDTSVEANGLPGNDGLSL